MRVIKFDEVLVLRLLLGFFVTLSILFLVRGCQIKDNLGNIAMSYKKTIIENDSLRKVSEGHYQKIVNDLESERSIVTLLKGENVELYEKIKHQNKKILSLTRLSVQPKVVTDTVFVSFQGATPSFIHYYPNSADWFIRYKGSVLDNSRISGSFEFQPLLIDLVLSEKHRGIYEVDLNAPDWLNVNSVRVNSLPMEYLRRDNFDWLFGGGLGFNYVNFRPAFGLQAGFRYKTSLYYIQGFTNNYVFVGYSKLF